MNQVEFELLAEAIRSRIRVQKIRGLKADERSSRHEAEAKEIGTKIKREQVRQKATELLSAVTQTQIAFTKLCGKRDNLRAEQARQELQCQQWAIELQSIASDLQASRQGLRDRQQLLRIQGRDLNAAD